MTAKIIDETGKRYGMLRVIRPDGNDTTGRVKWFCQCDCGNHKTVAGVNLRKNLTVSCGCLRNQLARYRTRKMGRLSLHLLGGLYEEDMI